jgi:hypothetical protein
MGRTGVGVAEKTGTPAIGRGEDFGARGSSAKKGLVLAGSRGLLETTALPLLNWRTMETTEIPKSQKTGGFGSLVKAAIRTSKNHKRPKDLLIASNYTCYEQVVNIFFTCYYRIRTFFRKFIYL